MGVIERWLPVVGYVGLYEVSDCGRVRSVDRVLERGGRWGPRKLRLRGQAIRPATKDYGHRFVSLSDHDGHESLRYVHVLVLEAFVGPRPDGLVTCHNDGDSANNRLDNLRWDTQSSNLHDTVAHGKHAAANKTRCPRNHLLRAPNLCSRPARRHHRSCLACARGYANWYYAHGRGVELDLQKLSDEHYVKIMGGAP